MPSYHLQSCSSSRASYITFHGSQKREQATCSRTRMWEPRNLQRGLPCTSRGITGWRLSSCLVSAVPETDLTARERMPGRKERVLETLGQVTRAPNPASHSCIIQVLNVPMQPFTEAVLNYFQQPPWTWPVSNLSNVLISSEAGNASPTPRSAAAVTEPSPALQRRLNVRVALSD